MGRETDRHSGAMPTGPRKARPDRVEPGISRFRVWSFGPSRNDGTKAPSLPVALPHPCLDLRHAADPAVVILGLLPHVVEHLRMRQDDKSFLLDPLQRILRDAFRRKVAIAGL